VELPLKVIYIRENNLSEIGCEEREFFDDGVICWCSGGWRRASGNKIERI